MRVAVVLALTVAATPITAQQFHASVGMEAVAFSASELIEGSREYGWGGGVVVGYRFTPRFGLYADAATAIFESGSGDYWVSHVGGGIRVSAHPVGRLVPFLDLGAAARTFRAVDAELCNGTACQRGDLRFHGLAFGLGAGTHYMLTRAIGATLAAQWWAGEFREINFKGVSNTGLEVDATSIRARLGLTWFR